MTAHDRYLAEVRAQGYKMAAIAEYRVELPGGGNARFDDYDSAYYASMRNGGTLTGRGRVRKL